MVERIIKKVETLSAIPGQGKKKFRNQKVKKFVKYLRENIELYTGLAPKRF